MKGKSIIIHRPYLLAGGSILLLGALYAVSLYSYLFFHVLAEFIGIAVACAVFLLAWNARRILSNSYLLFLGIAYLFAGSLDLLHTLAYKGMNVFSGYDADLPTQLWIGARYLQSLALLVAPLFLGRRLRADIALAGFAAVTVLLLVAIFGGLFPHCYIEGQGLTAFKKDSEYVICLILLGSLGMLYAHQKDFDPEVYRLVSLSVILTIMAELSFTFYVSVYGLSNLLGHFFKLGAFYFIYLAIIETGLVRPYDLLFRQLWQSKEKYQALFDNMADGCALHQIITDEAGKPVDFVFLEANEAFERLTGLNRGEIIGKRVTEVLPGIRQDPADWIGTFGAVALTGSPARFEQYAAPLRRWYSVGAYSTEHGKFATVFEDITDRKCLEDELARHQEHLVELVAERTRELQDANRDLRHEVQVRHWAEARLTESEARYVRAAAIGRIGHWELELAGNTGFWSAEACGLFGWEAEQRRMDIAEFLDVVHADDRDLFAAAMHDSIETGQRLDAHFRVVRPRGGERFIHSIAEVKKDAGGTVSGLEGVLMDVTEWKQAEMERLRSARLASIGELAAGVAHEVNNPINGIINYAQVLLDTTPGKDGETGELLRRIMKESERIAYIVRSLLTFSRQQTEEKKLVRIEDVVADIVPLVEGQLRKAGIVLWVEMADALPPILGNPQQLHQVILNAITNAQYALERKERQREGSSSKIIISGEMVRTDKENFVRISVLDNGLGIPDEILNRIVEPFFTTKPTSEGTGLGLSISHGIVADHGGRLRIDSVEGEFTELEIDFPATSPEPRPV